MYFSVTEKVIFVCMTTTMYCDGCDGGDDASDYEIIIFALNVRIWINDLFISLLLYYRLKRKVACK